MNIQTAYAKALLVDEARLAAAQARGRRARRPPGAARRLRDRRAAAARAAAGASSASTPIRSRRSAAEATPSGSPASGARRRSRARSEGDVTQRVAFVLRVRPDRIDEYVEAHRERLARDARRPPQRGHPQLLDLPGRERGVRLLRGRRSGRPRRPTSRSRRSAPAGRTRWPNSSRIASRTPGRLGSRRYFAWTEGRAMVTG